MKGFFSMDSPLFRFLETVTDLLFLTILWTVFSLPIVTIGASTTALFYVTLRMVKNEESYIGKNFMKGFTTNFKQATGLWIGFLPLGLLLGFVYFCYFYMMKGLIPHWLFPVMVVMTLFYFAYMMYAFALLARYENTNAQIRKNALLLMFKYLLRTFLMMAAAGFILVVALWNRYTQVVGVLLGMGTLVYIISSFMIKIFEILERDYQKSEPITGEQETIEEA